MILIKNIILNKRMLLYAASFFLFSIFWIILPDPLFNRPQSVVLEDKDDKLLGALIASDGQWRFPESRNVPDKFKKAITCFEDKRFYYHTGFDPAAFIRALVQNIKYKKIISGGSTLTMQVIRLSRNNRDRTFAEKIIEIMFALRLEISFCKDEILAMYSANAPFGGNVVGIEAASWRYFGCHPDQLSWAQTCMLAVLPNSPSLIHPGKNRKLLLAKRNALLKKLFIEKEIDQFTYSLAIEEPLPEKPFPLPRTAKHLLHRAAKEINSVSNAGSCRIKSTIDESLQLRITDIVERNCQLLSGNEINNAAVLVAEIESGEVRAYVGNTYNSTNLNDNDVDIIKAPRSTGSILKPFLYAAMLSSGELLPKTLLPDIPTNIGGFNPQNFDLGYSGAIPADRALTRSINIPAVNMLKKYRYEKFHALLKNLGITTLNKPANHYGLSLILGGAEATLWDLAGVYASLARNLKHYYENGALYYKYDYHPLSYNKTNYPSAKDNNFKDLTDNSLIDASAIWLMIKAMVEVERPQDENFWREFGSSRKIAWKTGTSFGFRDAWAIGIDYKYVVAVWVGNADGEGRPGLTGINTAAPILFDIFRSLEPAKSWYKKPPAGMINITVCRQSGYRAGEFCEEKDTISVPKAGLKFSSCPYHKLIHLDPQGKFQVTDECFSPSQMIHKSWFVLPPAMEYYYKLKNVSYKTLPDFLPGCNNQDNKIMELIYPRDVNKLYIPVNLDGSMSSVIFEIAHRENNSVIFWHLDNKYIGKTNGFHKLPINASKGKHLLTSVDDKGNELKKYFEVINDK